MATLISSSLSLLPPLGCDRKKGGGPKATKLNGEKEEEVSHSHFQSLVERRGSGKEEEGRQ